MTQIIQSQNFEALYDFCTAKGFENIFQSIVSSSNDPRLKLLKFKPGDNIKIQPTNVQISEKDSETIKNYWS